MHKDTLALERSLLEYLDDDRLSKAETRDLRFDLKGLPLDDLNFLRNRLFELARDRLTQAPDTAMAIVGWLDRGTKAINAELHQRQSTHQAWFTPGQDCLQHIIRQLNNARQHIDICVFTISDNRLSDSIVAAHRRDVVVRIISDNHKQYDLGSDLGSLSQQGIATRFDSTADHMHHKFCIIDGLTLINGSFNWTRSATERNQENIVSSQDTTLIAQFQNQFDSLWEAFA